MLGDLVTNDRIFQEQKFEIEKVVGLQMWDVIDLFTCFFYNMFLYSRNSAVAFNAVATSPGFDGGHSIGSAWGDFDNDGNIDLFAGNFAHRDSRGDQPKSRFLKNLGRKKRRHPSRNFSHLW